MKKTKTKKPSIWGLVVALIIVAIGSVLFMGAVGGWFDNRKIHLGAENYCEEDCGENEFINIDKNKYEDFIKQKKSMVILVDQNGCTTADRLREYALKWADTKKIRVYRMMFTEVKESSLHEKIKYYPSVAIIDRGKVRYFLRADSDEDAEEYNDYGVFEKWMNERIE